MTGRKKNVAQGEVQPPDSDTRYHKKPIPPEYALVYVAWMADDFDKDELDIPTEDGARTIGAALGSRVLWNKADIVLKMRSPASKPSQLPPSPPGGPSDDYGGNGGNDNGGDGNGNAGSAGSSPQHSPPLDTSNSQGGRGGAPGNETPPPSDPKGTGQCPPAPKKPTEQDEGKPNHLTTEEWAAFNIAEEYKYSTTFERYIC